MAKPIRVLLADDSIVVRRILTQALGRHSDIEIVGTGKSGKEALQLLQGSDPDVVLLDVEMPEMGGVEAAGAIRLKNRKVPIIMFSAITMEGGRATLDALARGANDYVTKPRNVNSLSDSFEVIDLELISKIRFWGVRHQEQRNRPQVAALVSRQAGKTDDGPQKPVDVIAFGISTGGPNSLVEVLAKFPKNLNVPVLIVQHMPPVFTQLLATRLAGVCPLPVTEAVQGEAFKPGHVYIAPGNKHLKVVVRNNAKVADLTDDPHVNSCRPAVDVLFPTVASAYGSNVLAVILTGMGRDGTDGAKIIKQKGGRVVAQDEATSVVWGMPRAVIEAGFVDKVVPLGDVAEEITRCTVYASRRQLVGR